MELKTYISCLCHFRLFAGMVQVPKVVFYASVVLGLDDPCSFPGEVFSEVLVFQPDNGINNFPKNCFQLKIFSNKKKKVLCQNESIKSH